MQTPPPSPPEGLLQVVTLLEDPALFDELTSRLIDAIASRLADLADDPELKAALEQGARQGVSALIGQIAAGESDLTLPPATLAVARTLARRGLSTEPLLNGFSSVRQSALSLFSEMSHLLAGGEDALPRLVEAWSYILWVADNALEALMAEHARERDLLVQSRTARRMDSIRELLAGSTVHTDAVSTSLGYPLRRHHTAAVGWTTTPELQGRPGRQVSASLAAWTTEHFPGQVLIVPTGSHGAWAWLATSSEPDPRALPHDVLPHGMGVAVGTTGYGPEGFRRSHEEAMLTQRIVRARGDATGVFLYDDLELAALLGTNQTGMAALVRRELRALVADEPAMEKLRDTLLAFYTANQQLAPAAAVLGVHKNTVRYRLQQAEDVLGHPLGERRAKVELALHCIKVHGLDMSLSGSSGGA